jgi:hypothetical protein
VILDSLRPFLINILLQFMAPPLHQIVMIGLIGWIFRRTYRRQIKDDSISVALDAAGHLDVYATRLDDAVWRNYQLSSNNDDWSGWESLYGQIKAHAAVALNTDGRIETFVVGLDNTVWHNYQLSQPT